MDTPSGLLTEPNVTTCRIKV